MTRKITIVQFGFEHSGGGSYRHWDSDPEIASIDSTLWALGEDGKLYTWEDNKWEERFKCIEVEDEEE